MADFDLIEYISTMMESNDYELSAYIDRETGELVLSEEYDEMFGDEESEDDEEFEYDEEFENLRERYLPIPHNGSRDSYEDMEEFIETVTDPKLKSRLQRAIDQRKPFANFKDVIGGSDEVNRWYSFSDAKRRARVIKWFEQNNIKLPAGV